MLRVLADPVKVEFEISERSRGLVRDAVVSHGDRLRLRILQNLLASLGVLVLREVGMTRTRCLVPLLVDNPVKIPGIDRLLNLRGLFEPRLVEVGESDDLFRPPQGGFPEVGAVGGFSLVGGLEKLDLDIRTLGRNALSARSG